MSNTPEVVFDSADVEKNKAFAVISYLWILFLIPLLAAKDSKFARFHAYQGLTLFLATLVVGVIVRLLPYNLSGLEWLLDLGLLVLAILGIVNAAQGRGRPLPVIGGFLQPDR
ncbi:MAG: hypothetical protein JSS11_01950 [Verrucomicrobia bacterium]|nr:hypothetical protein [Verrucomicrobiota bacterium]